MVKAVVLVEPARIRIQEFPRPRIPDDAALLRMEYTGICGTDKHLYRGEAQTSGQTVHYPIIPGHEPVAIVEEIGFKAARRMEIEGKEIKVGDRVVPVCDVRCEECVDCSRFYGYCFCGNVPWVDGSRTHVEYGLNSCKHPPHLFGAMAEFEYLIPQVKVAKVPDGVPVETAALTEVLAVIVSAFREAQLSSAFDPRGCFPDSTVVVQGPGPLGALGALYSKFLGAKEVIMTGAGNERDKKRLELLREMGAADRIVNDATSEDRIQGVKELTDGEGAELVAEITGDPHAIPEGIEMAGKGSTYLLLGVYVDMGSIQMNPFNIVSKQMRVIGRWSFWYQAYPTALRIMQQAEGKIPFGKVATHKFDLEDAEEAFATALTAPDALKVIVGRGPTHS